jgi:beta-lactamase regulating signal transducer with metallopeptidase domain
MEMSGWLLAGSQAAAAALIASVWQGMLLAATIWIALRVVPRATAGIRFFVWMAVFLAVALLPLLSVVPSLHSSAANSSALPASSPLLRLDLRWAQAIAAGWVAASLWQGVALARNGLRLRRLRKGSTPVEPSSAMTELLGSVKLRKVQLCSSRDVDQPCVLGFFAPRILVPDWLLAKSAPNDLEQIVRHELEHLRRLDDWANLLQKSILVVFPFNPVLYWIEKQLCAEREIACDEYVIRATRAPREYAACLVNLAGERMTRRRVAALSLGAWERRPELARRVHRILSDVDHMSPWKTRTIVAALLLATAAGSVELGKSSQLVAFTRQPELAAPLAAEQASMQKVKYQDVVYREAARMLPATVKTVSPNGIQATSEAVPTHKDLSSFQPSPSARKNSPTTRRVALNAPTSHTYIVFTQWETTFGPRMTVTLVQTSLATSTRSIAVPDAQPSSAWYVFQL